MFYRFIGILQLNGALTSWDKLSQGTLHRRTARGYHKNVFHAKRILKFLIARLKKKSIMPVRINVSFQIV